MAQTTDDLEKFFTDLDQEARDKMITVIKWLVNEFDDEFLNGSKYDIYVREEDNGNVTVEICLINTPRVYTQEFTPELLLSIYGKRETPDFHPFLKELVETKFEITPELKIEDIRRDLSFKYLPRS